ncbi:uncharacterized protein B0P05DRAFT_540400 [Gilbertella persicaria]|uniref:uncharacterized protein n=1 Tax=Gilbertella persicaria TaxID=101096 RepID=UPI00221E9EFA|nr:uncharacterized protein B0P05DRAFT_540400 [Gilbertella persicaria]KAI8080201.1 hypothetical protein B0P05DRAFT_540400 [Gilbertella persicaria]
MQLTRSMKTNQVNKNEVLRVVLDEPRIYVEESLGSVMIRGEVIVNFLKDTHIQGPIELLFEGIQRYHPWAEIMRGEALGSTIETKLQVIELSLLPPNSKGIMPAGVQRFPFEFPIPASLPATIFIRNRMEIFYQLSAAIRRSSSIDQQSNSSQDALNPIQWIEWARRTSFKKKYIASTTVRIVHAIESYNLPNLNDIEQPSTVDSASITDSASTTDSNGTSQTIQVPWNRRSLDCYQCTFDEQYDQLASSFTGKTSGNLDQPLDALNDVQGVRYKMSVDRTAVAIGTSVGIELMIEPTLADAVVKSVCLRITESRKFAMKVPAGHSWSIDVPKTKRITEDSKMILKWAYGYPLLEQKVSMLCNNKKGATCSKKKGEKYVYYCTEDDSGRYYFESPQPNCSKKFLKRASLCTLDSDQRKNVCENEVGGSFTASPKNEMINLKELNQPVRLGEYFGGRFVMPVPDCSNILNPSINHESLKILHWMELVVTIECNGKLFELTMNASSRMLDCRLVAVDDECQTILPPPPTYEPGDDNFYNSSYSPKSTFWEQREPITLATGWGSCMPCPCEHKKMKDKIKLYKSLFNKNNNSNSKCNSASSSSSSSASITENSLMLLPEWGPPPSYSEN